MLPVETSRNRTIALHACRGFGLIELVVAIAIVAVLTAAALPSFRELSRRMTISENTNNLVGALNTSRAEAVKRGSMVAVVGTGNDWTALGWTVQADSNHDDVIGGTDPVLATYARLTNDYTVKTLVTGGSDAQIIFTSQGNLAGPATQADINVCRPDHEAEQSAWIHIAASGEITSRRNTSSSPAPGC